MRLRGHIEPPHWPDGTLVFVGQRVRVEGSEGIRIVRLIEFGAVRVDHFTMHQSKIDAGAITRVDSVHTVNSVWDRFEPLGEDHPCVGTEVCPECGLFLRAGERPAFVNAVPADADEAAKADAGRAHTTEVGLAHQSCAFNAIEQGRARVVI